MAMTATAYPPRPNRAPLKIERDGKQLPKLLPRCVAAPRYNAEMPPKSRKPSDPAPALDCSGMPEFVRDVRGLANVSKAEVDAAIERERQEKKPSRGQKK